MSFNVIKYYYRALFRSPAVVFSAVILFVYAFLPLFAPEFYQNLSSGETLVVFLNFKSYFKQSPAVLVVCPAYAAFIQANRVFFEKESVLIRYANNFIYWKARLFRLLCDTVVFVSYIYCIMGGRLFLSGKGNELSLVWQNLPLAAVLAVLGLYLFGVIFQFLSAFTGRSALAFLLAYPTVLYESFKNIARPPLPDGYFVRAVCSPSILNGMQYTQHNLMTICEMIFVLTVLIACVLPILVRREHLIPKEKKDAH
jgi:hypothetical protein